MGTRAAWNRLESAVAGRPLRGPSGVRGPASARSPPARSVGAGRAARPRRPVRSLRGDCGPAREPTWAAPRRQPRASRRMCGDRREGHPGTVGTLCPGSRVGGAVVCVTPRPSVLRFLPSFPNVSVPQPVSPWDRQQVPKLPDPSSNSQDNFPSSTHSIVTNDLSSVVHFKQTQYLNCFFFFHIVMGGSFFRDLYFFWIFYSREKAGITTCAGQVWLSG